MLAFNHHVLRVLTDDADALQTVEDVAELIATDAARRDRARQLPYEQSLLLARSGLLAATVPRSFGGAGISYVTLGRIMRSLAAADPSLAQTCNSAFTSTRHIAAGTPEQQAHFFTILLGGARFGNGSADKPGHAPTTLDIHDETALLTGTKFYATGSLLADYVFVTANDRQGRGHVVVVPTNAPGLQLIDDWDSFGQRTSASGTMILNEVQVPLLHVFPRDAVSRPWPGVAIPHLMHSAIDLGIATAAVRELVAFVRARPSAYRNANIKEALEDPHVRAGVGRLHAYLHAGEALIERTGRLIDAAIVDALPASIEAAARSGAEARVVTNDVVLEATSKLFEFGGASATLGGRGLDRLWRDARVHTVHDPIHWRLDWLGGRYLDAPSI